MRTFIRLAESRTLWLLVALTFLAQLVLTAGI
jgi:hypothetical protein